LLCCFFSRVFFDNFQDRFIVPDLPGPLCKMYPPFVY
jgi:hypothetical protein